MEFSGNWRAVVTAEITLQPQANHSARAQLPTVAWLPGQVWGADLRLQTRSLARAAQRVLSLLESIQRQDPSHPKLRL